VIVLSSLFIGGAAGFALYVVGTSQNIIEVNGFTGISAAAQKAVPFDNRKPAHPEDIAPDDSPSHVEVKLLGRPVYSGYGTLNEMNAVANWWVCILLDTFTLAGAAIGLALGVGIRRLSGGHSSSGAV
jgi:hypothetical protein